MSKSKCRLCSLALVQREAQTRSDDEAPTLVVSCPVHGVHHDLVFKFFNVISNNFNITDNSNPSRSSRECTSSMNNLMPYPKSADITSIERMAISTIQMIPHALDEFILHSEFHESSKEIEILGARWCRNSFKRVSAGFLFYDNPIYSTHSNRELVYQEIVMDNTLSMSDVKIVDVTRCSKSVLHSTKVLDSLYTTTIVARFQYRGWNIVMCRSKEYDTIKGAIKIEDTDCTHDVCIDRAVQFQVVCSILLNKTRSDFYLCHHVSNRYSWNVWRHSCIGLLSRIRLTSIAVSEVDLIEDHCSTLIACKGTYAVICVSFDFGVIINGSATRATILPIIPRIAESQKKLLILRGYLNYKTFSLSSSMLVDLDSNSCTHDVDHNIWMKLDLDDDFEIVNVVKMQGRITDNWRMIYPGNQESIMITRRVKASKPRRFELESVICIIHRIIVLRMIEFVKQGIKTIFFIKSRPFLFYKELTTLAPCIFIYEEDWQDDVDGSDDVIDLSNSNDELIRCNYLSYEPVLELETTASMEQCRTSSSAGNPIHYNCKSVTNMSVDFGSTYVLMDFYNQCPEEFLDDCEYISVVGDILMERSRRRYWNMFEQIQEVDVTGTDLDSLCHALNQSLENIHIIHTPALKIHMRM